MKFRLIAAFVSPLLMTCATAPSDAFGVDAGEHGLGSEHERITRAAIRDVEPRTLDTLAGAQGEPGAVGTPDDTRASEPAAHCEGGDYLEPATGDPAYAQSAAAAQAAITACRDLIVQELELAVAEAKALFQPISSDVSLDCRFDGGRQSAKCAVLEHLGIAFHAAQDFYAHTNWVDRPGPGPIDVTNPPGLGNKGRSWWLDPRGTKMPFPRGLISSCHSGSDCANDDWIPFLAGSRVSRQHLGKGIGPIGRGEGGVGLTPRGAMNGNFRRAVAMAVEDTHDKWDYFKERVRAVYRPADAEMIICAMSRDSFDPALCSQRGTRERTCAARRALYVDDEAQEPVPLAAPTESELKEADALWDQLRPYCRLEEASLTRDAVVNGGTADQGRALGKKQAVADLALWNTCPAEGREHLNQLKGGTEGDLRAIDAARPETTRNVRSLLVTLYAQCIVDARLRQLKK